MKKIITLLLIAAFAVLAVTSCSGKRNSDNIGADIVNPVSSSSSSEILERFGVEMTPGSDYMNVGYSIISMDAGDIAQMDFILARKNFCYRVKISPELEDISGMSFSWENTAVTDVGGCDATAMWNEGEEGVILWNNGSITFSLSMDSGACESELISTAVALFSNGDMSAAAVEITDKFPYAVDLDGNGVTESILIDFVPNQEHPEFTDTILNVSDRDNNDYTANLGELDELQVWVADVDGDGCREILVSGSAEPESMRSFCCKYDGQLSIVLPQYDKYQFISGRIVGFGTGGFVVRADLNVFGTYTAERTFTLENEKIVPADGSIWVLRDNDNWLTAVRDVPANSTCGENMTLPAGTKLHFTAFDGINMLWFVDSKGGEGFLTVAPTAGTDSWSVDGVDESEYFAELSNAE